MSLSRKDFLKLMGGAAAAMTVPTAFLDGCKQALQQVSARTPVIWLQGQSCSGCSVSLLNAVDPDIASVITQTISLNYHQTIMGGTGHKAIDVLREAVENARDDFVLVVEGSIPTLAPEYCTVGMVHGHHVPVKQWVEELAERAKAIVAVGTCAAFGGIPAAKVRADNSNPTGAKGVSEILPGKTVLNVPGCPPHPAWMVGSLVHFLVYGLPELDEYNRPKMFFGQTVHENCERLNDYRRGRFARHWGEDGCLYLLGCLGMDSGCDIPRRKWNGGANSCTGSGSGCIGCTEPTFPDTGNRGIYQHLNASLEEINKIENEDIRLAVLNLRNGGIING
ncbi:MAG: hydrogenase small subunit [Spirochaetes bacterium]|nr:hydrogenase small subunit [Spirochaetota bacterium]